MNSAQGDPYIERMLKPLEELMRQAVSPEQFYRAYLQNLLGSLPGKPAGGHLWSLQGREFVSLGGSTRAPSSMTPILNRRNS